MKLMMMSHVMEERGKEKEGRREMGEEMDGIKAISY